MKNLKKMNFFDFSKWLLIIIYHRNSVSNWSPDFKELFSTHIDTPNKFGEKNFWLQNDIFEAVFCLRASIYLENCILWWVFQNPSSNTRCSSASMCLETWRTWSYLTFYLSFLRKNNFSQKFWKKIFRHASNLRKMA